MAWNGNIVQSLVFCLVSCRSLSVLFSLFVWLLFHDIVLFIVSHYPFGIFKLCISRGRESENLGKIGKMFVSALFSIFWQLLRHFCRTNTIYIHCWSNIFAPPSKKAHNTCFSTWHWSLSEYFICFGQYNTYILYVLSTFIWWCVWPF